MRRGGCRRRGCNAAGRGDQLLETGDAGVEIGDTRPTTLAFSAKDRVPGSILTAWIDELNWNFGRHNTLFGRIENVDNNELFPDHDDPIGYTLFARFNLGR